MSRKRVLSESKTLQSKKELYHNIHARNFYVTQNFRMVIIGNIVSASTFQNTPALDKTCEIICYLLFVNKYIVFLQWKFCQTPVKSTSFWSLLMLWKTNPVGYMQNFVTSSINIPLFFCQMFVFIHSAGHCFSRLHVGVHKSMIIPSHKVSFVRSRCLLIINKWQDCCRSG